MRDLAWALPIAVTAALTASLAAAQAADRATVTVSTGEPGAEVTIDSGGERRRCVAPCRADVPAGRASVTVIRGGRSVTSSVELLAGESTMQVVPPGGDLFVGLLWVIAWAELEAFGFGLAFGPGRTDTGLLIVGDAIGGLGPILAVQAAIQFIRYAVSGSVEVRRGSPAPVTMRWGVTPIGLGLALSF